MFLNLASIIWIGKLLRFEWLKQYNTWAVTKFKENIFGLLRNNRFNYQ